eukprot:4276541-Prymnesium_polylepis.1
MSSQRPTCRALEAVHCVPACELFARGRSRAVSAEPVASIIHRDGSSPGDGSSPSCRGGAASGAAAGVRIRK